jgi:hypothetical protein
MKTKYELSYNLSDTLYYSFGKYFKNRERIRFEVPDSWFQAIYNLLNLIDQKVVRMESPRTTYRFPWISKQISNTKAAAWRLVCPRVPHLPDWLGKSLRNILTNHIGSDHPSWILRNLKWKKTAGKKFSFVLNRVYVKSDGGLCFSGVHESGYIQGAIRATEMNMNLNNGN